GRPSDRTVEIQNNSAPSMVCSTRSQGVADAFGSLKRASSSAAGIAAVIAHLLRHQYGTPGPVLHHVGVGHAMRSATPSTSATASAADSRTDAPRGNRQGWAARSNAQVWLAGQGRDSANHSVTCSAPEIYLPRRSMVRPSKIRRRVDPDDRATGRSLDRFLTARETGPTAAGVAINVRESEPLPGWYRRG